MFSIINFFLNKSKLTYFILFFITLTGIYFANILTKEVFPPISLEKVMIQGGYGTASIKSLDELVVDNLEDGIKNIVGVRKIESYIQNGTFKSIVSIKNSANKNEILGKIKDIIQAQKRNYPSDMNEPTVTLVDRTIPLIQVSMSSDVKSLEYLKELSKDLKKDILKIQNIASANIYDDSEYVYKFIFDYKKIEALNINKQTLIASIQSFSHIAPIGSIENSSGAFFISTQNGKDNAEDILNTIIKVDNRYIYIRDIAEIKYEHRDSSILSFSNKQPSINISVSRDKIGNSIAMQEKIIVLLEKWRDKHPDIELEKFFDTTVWLINRFNVVISSLMFGILLVGMLVWLMVNIRTALLVSIGVPFAFLFGIIFLYLAGFSINMMSLLGALIILGVIVDDAIIVGENIQRHMNLHENKMDAIRHALKEVIAPIIVACFTTIFAFLPLLLISGEMGEFMKLIPVAIIVLIFGSLLESFIFLPLHSKHILKENSKELDWSKALNVYEKILKTTLRHKKKFLLGFYILIPIATGLLFANLKYTLFPQFDGNNVYVKGAFDSNHTIEDTARQVAKIEDIIYKAKEELAIKNITTLVGFRIDDQRNSEISSNVFDITLELHSLKPQNVFEKYITPTMSFYKDYSLKAREVSSNDIVNILKEKLKLLQADINVEEFSIKTDGPGIVKHPIEIEFNGNEQDVIYAIGKIKRKISSINGVINVDDNIKKGSIDLKLFINKYGESLGINELHLAKSLNAFFSNREFSQSLSKEGVVSLISKDKNKDNINTLKAFTIPILGTNKFVSLTDVVDFVYISNYKEVYKIAGEKIKYMFADIDSSKITAEEILTQIKPLLDDIRKQGVDINMRGESEQNKQLQSEMSVAFALSIFLIFAILLIMFNSYRYALIVISIIPLSIIGALLGHFIMDQKMSMPSFIGIIGLAGVVINDGIVMLSFLKKCDNMDDLIEKAKLRLRPVLITSITTFMGLSILIFFATGQAKILQPIAISLGYGMLWGTILTLLYAPIMSAIVHHFDETKNDSIMKKIKNMLKRRKGIST